MAHVYAGKQVIIVWDNGLLSIQRKSITWSNTDIVSIKPLRRKSRKQMKQSTTYSFKKCIWICGLQTGDIVMQVSVHQRR